MTSHEIDEYLYAIIMAGLKNPIEADQLLNQFLGIAKKHGHSKPPIIKRYKDLKAGVEDKLKMQKQKESGHLKIVGGLDHGDKPLPAFECNVEQRGAVAQEVRRLLGTGAEVFAYGPDNVEVDFQPVAGLWRDTAKTQPALFARPVALDLHRAVRHIERVCKWHTFNMRAMANVPKPVPDWCALAIAKGPNFLFRPLAGIIRHPVLTPENKLLTGERGYDHQTQSYVWCSELHEDPAEYEWDSPAAAYRWLIDDWLGEFQFATPADAARAILVPLTLLKARTCLARAGKYPGFMVTAPMAASGKTQLVAVLTSAITCETVPYAPYPAGNDEEMAKFLMAISMSDPTCFCFDNIPNGSAVKSPNLDAFVTNTTFSARKLGANEVPSYPSLSVVLMTGNNIEAAEDSRSRHVEIRLEPAEKAPQNHVYIRNIMAFTDENRAMIISALTRICTAGAGAIPKMGRFPAWFDAVAAPVIAASGEIDLLSRWKEEGSTIRNADAFESFLERIAEIESKGRPNGLWPIDVVKGAIDEVNELVNLKATDYAEATALMDPVGNTQAQNDKIAAARNAAIKRIASDLTKRLKGWKDQRAGDFRLRLIQKNNSDGKMRVAIHAEFCGLNKKTTIGRNRNYGG